MLGDLRDGEGEELFDLTRTGRLIPIYTDEIGFVLGPAEIGLEATSIVQPVAATTEAQLASLLLERAKASMP